jgi:uncharacterized protein
MKPGAAPAESWTLEDIEWIDSLLMDEDNGLDQPLFASEMDGFLCAVISGPQLIPPTEALRWIFDAEAGEQTPQFANPDDAERLMKLVMRQWNHIANSLADGSYQPLLMKHERADGAPMTLFADWCAGYMTGVGLDREGWRSLLEGEGALLLHTMLMYGTEDGCEALERNPPSDAEHEARAEALADEACAIRDYWFSLRVASSAAASAVSPSTAAPSPDQPCHCGSGRPYKHCYGAN